MSWSFRAFPLVTAAPSEERGRCDFRLSKRRWYLLKVAMVTISGIPLLIPIAMSRFSIVPLLRFDQTTLHPLFARRYLG